MPVLATQHLPRLFAGFRRLATEVRDAAVATLYPQSCLVCAAQIESWRDGVACHACWTDSETLAAESFRCAKCGLPLSALASYLEPAERLCGRCENLAFNVARACGIYEGAWRETVLWQKRHPHVCPRARQQLRQTFERQAELHYSDVIVPVPLHTSRLSERTFNQAEIIAQALASTTGLPVNTASLVRAKQTERHRAGLGARERARSLAGAFRVRAPRLLENRAVLLVDDVLTTGSTAHELAQTLLKGGARSVAVLTLARARTHFI